MSELDPSPILSFAIERWAAYPNMQIQDAYKWLYQATLGGEHAAMDAERSRSRLNEEWNLLGDASFDEELWEPLRKDISIGRLHLRPFKQLKGSIDSLNEAFLTSSREHVSEHKSFVSVWCELGNKLSSSPTVGLTHSVWIDFHVEIKEVNFPAISHSESYRTAYRPAYRILTNSVAEKLLKLNDRDWANS